MKYNDKVRVTSWFYEGMEGNVLRESVYFESQYNKVQSTMTLDVKNPIKKVSYICEIINWPSTITTDWINESDLEKLENKECMMDLYEDLY